MMASSRIAADLVMALHFAFSAFALFGGFLAIVDPAWAWVHVPTVAWAAAMNFADWTCPLTPLEKRLRERSGAPAYDGDFVQHYLGSLISARITSRQMELVSGSCLLAWNAFVYAVVWQVRS